MRTFEQFIGRRKIRNVSNWLAGMNITTEEQLRAWCDTEGVYYPKQSYFDVQLAEPQEASPVVAAPPPSPKVTPKVDKEWIPAAERSRKSRGRKPKVAKPVPKMEPEDESNANNVKKPVTKQRKR